MNSEWSQRKEGFYQVASKKFPEIRNAPLFQKFEMSGYFWLANKPENKLGGNLYYFPGQGIRIVLNGAYWREPGQECYGKSFMLNGRMGDGQLISVYGCFTEFRHVLNFTIQNNKSVFESDMLIFGCHYNSLEEIFFKSYIVSFSHLNEIFEYGINFRYSEKDNYFDRVEYNPESFELGIEIEKRKYDIQLCCSRNLPFQPFQGEWSLCYQYHFRIVSESVDNIKIFSIISSLLRKFLMFFCSTNIFTLGIAGQRNDKDSDVEIDLKDEEVFIPVLMPGCTFREVRWDLEKKRIAELFKKGLVSWFEKHETLEVVIKAYSDLLQDEGSNVVNVFLRIVQTLEHFHEIIFPDSKKYLNRMDWRRLQDWLKENFPNQLMTSNDDENNINENIEIRKSILNRFGNLNKISFLSKIEELFGKLPKTFLPALFKNPKEFGNTFLSVFLKKVDATRHYFTHYSEEMKKKSFHFNELEDVTIVCWMVLNFWLAREIGFDEEEAELISFRSRKSILIVYPLLDL